MPEIMLVKILEDLFIRYIRKKMLERMLEYFVRRDLGKGK